MSITLSSVVFSPIVSGVTTAIASVTVPAGTTALLIAGFVDVSPVTVGNATVAQFNSVNMELVAKSMPGTVGRPIWVYKMVNPPVGTFNAVFNDGSSNSRQLAAWTVQSTNTLIIDGNAGNVGYNTTPLSTILSSYVSGKVLSILSANNASPTDVTETGGQTILGENTYSAGFLYAGVDVKTPTGPIGSATTAAWTLATAQEWGELSISIREVTKASSSTSDSSVSGQLSTIITNIGTLSALVTTDYNATISAIATQTTGQNTRFSTIDTNVGVAISNISSLNTNLNSSTSTLIGRFNTVDTVTSGIASNVTAARSDISIVSTQVGGVSTQVTAAKAVIDSTKTVVDTINAVGATTRFNTLDTLITNARTVIDNINSTTTSTYNNTNTMTSRFNTLDASVGAVNSQQATRFNTVDTNTAAIKGVVDTINAVGAGTRFNTIDTNVAAVKSVVDTINAVGATTRFNTIDTKQQYTETLLYNQNNAIINNVAGVRGVVDALAAIDAASQDWYGSAMMGWAVGETKKLTAVADEFTVIGTYSLVNRHKPVLLTATNSPMMYTRWRSLLSQSKITYGNFNLSGNVITGMGMGSNGVLIAVSSDYGSTGGYIHRATSTTVDFTTPASVSYKLGNPVCNGSSGTYWVIPVMGSQSVFYSSDSGVTWNLSAITGVPSGFLVSAYQRAGAPGLQAIHWDGSNFITMSGNLTYRSSNGISWTMNGSFSGTFTPMHFWRAQGNLIAYGWDQGNSRCGFQYSSDSGATWTAGGYFPNNGVAINTLNEATKHQVVFSGYDNSTATTPRWYKSGSVNCRNTGAQVLFEYLDSAIAAGSGTSFVVTNPGRDQYVTFHAGNCVSIDCDYFSTVLDRAVLTPYYASLADITYIMRNNYSTKDFNAGYINAHLGKIINADFAMLGNSALVNRAYRIQVMPGTNNENEAGYIINLTLMGYAALVYPTASSRTNASGGAVLPPLMPYCAPTENLYTRIN